MSVAFWGRLLDSLSSVQPWLGVGDGGRFIRDPLLVFYAGGCCEQIRQGCPLTCPSSIFSAAHCHPTSKVPLRKIFQRLLWHVTCLDAAWWPDAVRIIKWISNHSGPSGWMYFMLGIFSIAWCVQCGMLFSDQGLWIDCKLMSVGWCC